MSLMYIERFVFAIALLLVWSSLLVGPTVCFLILAYGIKNWREKRQEHGSIAVRLILSLIVWAGLSMVMLFLCLIVFSAGEGYPPGTNIRDVEPRWWSPLLILLSIGYAWVGGMLVYWMTGKPRPVQ